MTVIRLILGDQLSMDISSLHDADKQHDIILLCEVLEETQYVKHHQKKIAYIFSAMRHFAKELHNKQYKVHYIELNDPHNTGNFSGEVLRAIKQYNGKKIIVTEPGEYRLLTVFNQWDKQFKIPVEIRTDQRFLCNKSEFATWAKGRKQLRMEYFYQTMRRKYHILMLDDKTPCGGQWNFDKENRKSLRKEVNIPKRISHKKSPEVKAVLALVAAKFSNHMGELEPFHFAVTRKQALKELQHFIEYLLPYFGDYQDAMVENEPYLYHSLLSTYINSGLLSPLEVCKAAENAYHQGHVKINAAEGFIRQILGWREFIRGIYWLHMPKYADLNFFQAKNNLPEFYWNGKTDMHCLAQAIDHTLKHAYSHHIQRLMLTGNFALLSEIDPKQVCEWYLAVYADAYEWVELPNTLGMALFADGGIIASKPYIASGKYINRMSNYCQHCRYNPKINEGENACPFNLLFWQFLKKHQKVLRQNPRLRYLFAHIRS